MNYELDLIKQFDLLTVALFDLEQLINKTLDQYNVIDERHHKVFVKGDKRVEWKHECYTDDGNQEFMVENELCYGYENAKLHTLKLLNQ